MKVIWWMLTMGILWWATIPTTPKLVEHPRHIIVDAIDTLTVLR